MFAHIYPTIIGNLLIVEENSCLIEVEFNKKLPSECTDAETSLIKKAYAEISEYLSGRRRKFDLPLAPKGTVFQQKVWQALQTIPYGETRSYQEIACQIGNPKACRAVGQANNKNPICIIIPCHRVIGKSGKLVGYAGGLDIKEQLLKTEQKK